MNMKLYYVAYRFPDEYQMIDGPFGTASEAEGVREEILEGIVDEKLVVVSEIRNVYES